MYDPTTMSLETRFLEAYNLKNGLVLNGHTLKKIELKENTSVFGEKRYPIVMFWQQINLNYTSENLINSLDDLVVKDRTIEDVYGNGYMCHFGRLDHFYKEKLPNGNEYLVVNPLGYCRML